MEDNQQSTLDSYNHSIERYITYTASKPTGEFLVWMDEFIELLPEAAKVLEIGSGPGRDADYLASRGVDLMRTDAAQSFIEHQRSNGHQIVEFNPLKTIFPRQYQAVFGAGVLLHFTEPQLKTVLKNLLTELDANGLICFSVKQGTGEDYSEHKIGLPRYFKYWERAELDSLLQAQGVKICSVRTALDGKWLLYIGRKSD
jgi:2-polyprenyl-3-methyl-5-hydroxy-6-metoxy-1,4-benzoquinol methylase